MPQIVADLGCGTGNIAIPLAEEGMIVYGIDISDTMLSVAREKGENPAHAGASKAGDVRWLQQDMREWETPEPVDSVVSFCDSLNYLLEEDDLRQTFRRTHAGLKAGGLFIFDMHHPNQLRRYWEAQPYYLNEEAIAYIWTCEWDEGRLEIEHDLTLFVATDNGDGHFRRIDETHIQRAYDPEWVVAELRRSGFVEVDLYADFRFVPPDEDTERLFFVARK
jgi:SAM-dependent methyltransferase